MNWNLVSSTSDDETITNVFRKNHIFKLTPDMTVNTKIIFSLFCKTSKDSHLQLTERAVVQAIVRNHRMIVSVDDHVFLLENDEEIECDMFCFESQIDAIELSWSGLVVICALKNGNIHGFHIKGGPIFNM